MWLRLLLLITLLVVAALLLASYTVKKVPQILGGALSVSQHQGHTHQLGRALLDHARSLGPEDALGPHPLDRDHYEAPRLGGAVKTASRVKSWEDFATWEDLKKDDAAHSAYLEERSAVLENPNLDWSEVLAEIGPKLNENREYIGIANLKRDGRTLSILAYEPSPEAAGDVASETAFAGVPSELVEKYARRPGLFLFHTHPADPRGSPLPSSHDLSTAIFLGATARFAGCAVISRYGVLVHGIDWSVYKEINSAKDWKLTVMGFSHDVVAAHESMRSWSMYTLDDYAKFYPRYRMFLFTYPSPEMVGDSRRYSYQWNLDSPIDYPLIADLAKSVSDYRDNKKSRRKKSSDILPEFRIGFD